MLHGIWTLWDFSHKFRKVMTLVNNKSIRIIIIMAVVGGKVVVGRSKRRVAIAHRVTWLQDRHKN